MTEDQHSHLCRILAARERRSFERNAEKIAHAYNTIEGDLARIININHNEVHDYTRGPKPVTPTRPDKIPDYVELVITNINITTLEPNKPNLNQLPGIAAFQEHQTPQVKHQSITKQWKRGGKFIKLGPPSLVSGHASAGVGFQHDHTTLTTRMEIRTEIYQRIYDQGRVIHMGVVIDRHVSFTLYVCLRPCGR